MSEGMSHSFPYVDCIDCIAQNNLGTISMTTIIKTSFQKSLQKIFSFFHNVLQGV